MVTIRIPGIKEMEVLEVAYHLIFFQSHTIHCQMLLTWYSSSLSLQKQTVIKTSSLALSIPSINGTTRNIYFCSVSWLTKLTNT